MDTKSKKLADRTAARVIAFILCVVFVAGAAVFAVNGITKMDNRSRGSKNLIETDFLSNRPVLKSETYRNMLHNAYYALCVMYEATSGNALLESGQSEEPDAEPKEALQDEIDENKEILEYGKKDLASIGVDNYFIGDGSDFVSNVPVNANSKSPTDPTTFRENHRGYFSYVGGHAAGASEESIALLRDSIIVNSETLPADYTVYLSFRNDTIREVESQLAAGRAIVVENGIPALSMLIAAFVLFILLLVWTGRKRADGTRKIYALDNIFPEVQIAIMIAVTALGFALIDGYGQAVLQLGTYTSSYIGLSLVGAIALAFATSLLWFFLSLVRGIKSGLIVKRSLIRLLICKPIRFIFLAIKAGFDKSNPLSKTIFLVVILWLVTAFASLVGLALSYDMGGNDGIPLTMLILGIVLLAALYFTSRWVKRYGELKKGVDEIAGGNLKYKIPVGDNAKNEFDNLSRKVNEIGSASDVAIQNELKNQRLKTDLISNVSHDLKTPLTSIITYTDLLKKEGLTSERAEEYLNIIDEKSERLKKLTEDLFDAAKASSGAVAVQMTRVDLLSLISQELAEFEQQLADNGLEVIVGAVQDHYYVRADSQLLWRVVDNLLGNVRKYALPGSRVYIDITEHRRPARSGQSGDAIMTVMEMKNISATRLNIPADELMERFQRGDEARTTDGSGLGLAIAKDLVKLQNGFFEVSIDGDLFKATTMLEPWTD